MDVPKAIILCAVRYFDQVGALRKPMAWLPFGSWSSNMEKDGHSRLSGGLINLLDGCAVRYFDQVGALNTGGTER
ncbi:unnamed protein product [Prunus armeniaca]